ncbi:MAG: IS110 family transposase [Ignavibacteria bacterium]
MKKEFFLGIDVSKGYADFTILDENKKVVEDNFQLDDTFSGHNTLFKVLSDFFVSHPDSHLYAAVESTGGYENNWFDSLHKYQSDFKISVARVNPFGVHYNSKATLERIITDKQSAKNIAGYLINHPEKVNYQKDDYFSAQRRQFTFIKLLKKQKAQSLNQLESFLYISNPEIIKYCNDGVPQWVLKLLTQYPTAKHLSKARISTVSKIPYLKKTLAAELINNAKQSVASAIDDTTADIIKALATHILSFRKLINDHINRLEKSCNIPETELIKTFPGIGIYSAVGLMIEIVSVSKFSSAKKLASFFGIHPVFKQSGDKLSGFRMSKRGRKQPRVLLYNVARISIIHNPLMKEIYASHLKKGMSKMAAIGALMHKILRIIYGMLKNNTAFDPEIDRKNSDRVMQVTESKPGKERRYHKLDSKAPISRRQNKKRKEQNSSQDELASNTGSSSSSFQFSFEQT